VPAGDPDPARDRPPRPRPGRRTIRRLALWIDSRVEGAAAPNARAYAHFVAPLFGAMYRRVADDVAAEVAGRGGGLAILDLGCGPGELAAMLSLRLPEARIVGLDIAPAMVELARRRSPRSDRLSFEVGDVARLAFESGSIDVVVSSLSLHHWPDPGAAFAEISRVLRPGGTALLYDLDLVTLEPERLPDVARRAGLPVSRLLRERPSGGLLARPFVRFRVDSPLYEAADDASPSAPAAGHARIPAAVTPGEVA
jgi:SAM-dependent methyltransferase